MAMRFVLDTVTRNAVNFMNYDKKAKCGQITRDSAGNVTVKFGKFSRSIFLIVRLSQWQRAPWRECDAAILLGLRVRIPPAAWTSVCCECCVFAVRGLSLGLITPPEESYRLGCV
jgi:hypothetical protein